MESRKPRESTILFASGLPMNEIEQKMQQQIQDFGNMLDQKQGELHRDTLIQMGSKDIGGIGTKKNVID